MYLTNNNREVWCPYCKVWVNKEAWGKHKREAYTSHYNYAAMNAFDFKQEVIERILYNPITEDTNTMPLYDECRPGSTQYYTTIGTPDITRMWVVGKSIKPTDELTTPHLRNIVKSFKDDPEKYKQYAKEDPHFERRFDYVCGLLNKRDAAVKREAHDVKIKLDGLMRQIRSQAVAYMDTTDVVNTIKQTIGLITQLEKQRDATHS
jgi:hypothetical protein